MLDCDKNHLSGADALKEEVSLMLSWRIWTEADIKTEPNAHITNTRAGVSAHGIPVD